MWNKQHNTDLLDVRGQIEKSGLPPGLLCDKMKKEMVNVCDRKRGADIINRKGDRHGYADRNSTDCQKGNGDPK